MTPDSAGAGDRPGRLRHICLFDIDGTLLHTGGAGGVAMLRALERDFGTFRPDVEIPTAGRTDRAITADLFAHYGIDPTEELWERFRLAYLEQLALTLHECAGQVLPGVVALLEGLAARDDVFLGVLTGNYRDGARLKLEHYGLARHFAVGGYGDQHLHRNDVAREALGAVIEHLGERGEANVWVIGDTPSDIRCGREIGARVIAVATGQFSRPQLEPESPDWLLDDLSQVDDVLRLLA